MPVTYLLTRAWQWIADQGLTLAILLVIAILVPRIARFIQRWLNRGIEENTDVDESKTRLALSGVFVYVAQIIAFFVLLVFFLQALGFSLASAAIPATVVSAAIGFGAQSIIADFLAGFFILTEKQYGVGDWVRFEGNGIVVEGTVIQITMRATRIRTLKQETVIVSNSTARVAINSSNFWSRAVVVMPVPLLGSDNAQEAIDRSEAATRRALRRPDVAKEIIGDLDVHPAVDVTPPATVGMPWTVDMRFMIQVEAGSQWLVERAIRTEILDEFWDEYGSATTITGDVKDRVESAPRGSTATTLIDAPSPSHDSAGDEESTVPAGYADEEGRDPAVVDRGPQGDEPEDDAEEGAGSADQEEAEEEDKDEDKKGIAGVFRRDAVGSRWQRLVSAGGRVRSSTTYLFAVLFLLLVFKGLTVDAGEGGSSGVLAPRPAPTAPASPTVEPVPSFVPEPTWTTEPAQPTETLQSPTPTPTQDAPLETTLETTLEDQSPDEEGPQTPAPAREPEPTPTPQPEVTPEPAPQVTPGTAAPTTLN